MFQARADSLWHMLNWTMQKLKHASRINRQLHTPSSIGTKHKSVFRGREGPYLDPHDEPVHKESVIWEGFVENLGKTNKAINVGKQQTKQRTGPNFDLL